MSYQSITVNPTYKAKAVDYTGYEDIKSTASAIGLALNQLNLLTPAGGLMPFAGDTAPIGFLLCDGSAVSRVTYGELFSVIGTKYGSGDGSTTFNLPDLRGRVIAGYNSGVSYYNLVGKTGGNNTHAITTTEMPAHNHTVTIDGVSNHNHTFQDAYFAENAGGGGGKLGTSASTDTDNTFYYRTNTGGYTTNASDPTTQINTSSAGAHTHTNSVSNTGGGAAIELLQPYITMNYIIKW